MKKIYAITSFLFSFGIMAHVCGAELMESFVGQEEYNQAVSAFQQKQWSAVKSHGKKVLAGFPEVPELSDIYYYIGVAYFNQKDYDMANRYFSEYLTKYASPHFFEDAIVHKYQIAAAFQKGSGKHLMGYEQMPQWQSAWEDAYAIYTEVISTLPRHEVAAKSLFHKAAMLRMDENYKEALNCYETLIRRFPKHPLAPDSYVEIAHMLYDQSKESFPDREFIEEASLNYKKFTEEFPSEPRLVEVKSILTQMEDRCAKELWESALYYAKKKKFASSILYCNSLAQKYPDSKYAYLAKEKATELRKYDKTLIAHETVED